MFQIGRLSLVAGSLVLVAGCAVDQYGRVTLGVPMVVVQPGYAYAPPPPVVVEAPVMVPDSYVMVDGEYVGMVGDQYFYLGGGGVWLACDPVRIERFHGWEREHGDWREHAIRNDQFRRDASGHEQPRRDDRAGGPGRVAPDRGDTHAQPGHAAPAKKAAPRREKETDRH